MTNKEERVPWEYTGVARIPCQVGAGGCPGEYGVEFRHQLWVSATKVLVKEGREPRPGEVLPGELRVRVIGRSTVRPGWVVVRLPAETLNCGPTIEVPASMLRGEYAHLIRIF